MNRVILLLTVTLSFCCPVYAEPSSQVKATNQIQLHRYTSIAGWGVNAYWIETANQIVIIDALLLQQDARQMAAAIKLSGKPVAGVFITHPHPDHIGGLMTLQKIFGPLKIYTDKASAQAFNEQYDMFINSSFSKPFSKNLEKKVPKANQILVDNDKVTIDGVDFIFRSLGAGEAVSNSLVYVPQRQWLFTGDVTMHHAHYYVGEGRSTEVLKQFRFLQENYAEARYFTGHGEPSDSLILKQHIAYVQLLQQKVQLAVNELKNLNENRDHLTREKRRQLAEEVHAAYPELSGFGLEKLSVIGMNLYGIESEILAQKPKAAANP